MRLPQHRTDSIVLRRSNRFLMKGQLLTAKDTNNHLTTTNYEASDL
jgi:hypothetical protein